LHFKEPQGERCSAQLASEPVNSYSADFFSQRLLGDKNAEKQGFQNHHYQTKESYLFNSTSRFFNTKHTKRRNSRKMLIVDVRVFRVFCVEKHAGTVSVELSMSFSMEKLFDHFTPIA